MESQLGYQNRSVLWVDRERKLLRPSFEENAESNTIVRNRGESIIADDPIPVESLLVMDGTLMNIPVQILKDDGCDTNIVSKRLVNKNRPFLLS